MTTNIYDRNVPKLVSDSRWSIEGDTYITYIDDYGCDKILCTESTAFMFAGSGLLIQAWKDWLQEKGKTEDRPPITEGELVIAICAVNMVTGVVEIECRQAHTLPDARFTGTGWRSAHACWEINKDPCKAVESAIASDTFSGGTVKFVNLSNGENNIQNTATMTDTLKAMASTGWTMFKHNLSQPIPIKDAAKQDPAVQELVHDLAAGNARVCAPYPGMDIPWTQAEEDALDANLRRILGR